MFDQTFVPTHAEGRRPFSLLISLTAQILTVGALLILPLLHPEVLRWKIGVLVFIPLHSVADLPLARMAAARPSAAVSPRRTIPSLTAPARVPQRIAMIADAPDVFEPGLVGPLSGSTAAGAAFLSGLSGTLPGNPPPAPQPAPAKKPEPPKGPMRVSSGVQSALLIFAPSPPYPTLAKSARIQGTVRLQAIVARDGSIRNLQVMSGPPLLVKAALDAVSRWRYRPTLLNGDPVEVITGIDVNFSLSQ